MKNHSKRYYELFLLLLTAAQILFLAYMNLFESPKMIDYDGAKLYMHAMEMWHNKSFFIPGWKYITTMELDCSLLLAVPFYALSHNIFLAFGLSNLIMICGFAGVIYVIFCHTPYRRHALAAVILVLTPYAYGMLEYFNMMFFNGSQYVIKVLLPLLLIQLLTVPSGRRKTKGNILFLIVYSLLLFLTSLSSGFYVMFCGLLPLLLYTGFDFLYHREIRKYGRYHLSIGIVTLAAFAAGCLAGNISGIVARGNILFLTKPENWQLNLNAVFLGLFQALDTIPVQDISAVSGDGILYLARVLLLFLLLAACVSQIRALFCPEDTISAEHLLALLLPWNLVILLFIDTRYSPGNLTMEYRYYLIALVPLMLLLPMQLDKWIRHADRLFRSCICALTVICLLLLAVGSDRRILENRESSLYANDICDYIDGLAQDVESVFFVPDEKTPEICRLLDPARTYCGYNASDGLVVYDYYQSYIDRNSHGNHNLILVYDWETPDMYLPAYISSQYEKIGHVRWYDVYYAPVNLFDSVSGFSAFGDSVDFLYSPGYTVNSHISSVNDAGELEVNGNGEETVSSGDFPPVQDAYQVTVLYEETQNGRQANAVGVMEIRDHEEVVASVELPSGQESAVIKNLAVDGRTLSVHITINNGVSCRLKSLRFTKLKQPAPSS